MRLRRRKPSFPNPGTDRRPDELERNLQTEDDAAVSLERAQETDRVADEDRESEGQRTEALEDIVVKQKRQIDFLAAAVLIVLVLGFAISVSSWVTARHANQASRRVEANATNIKQFCTLVISVHVDRVRRLSTSIAFLESPAGRDHSGFNNAIRSTLPATRAVAIQERRTLPRVCVAGRKLPDIPRITPP